MTGSAERQSHSVTALLERVRAGEEKARSELWDRVEKEVRAIVRSRLRREAKSHRPDTTDIVGEIYCRLFRNGPPDFENRVHFFGSVARIVTQILIGEARRRKRRPKPIDPEKLETILVEASAESLTWDDFDALEEVLARFDEKPRYIRMVAIFRMRLFGGLSPAEIAEKLRVSLDTVKKDFKYVRARIMVELKKGRKEE